MSTTNTNTAPASTPAEKGTIVNIKLSPAVKGQMDWYCGMHDVAATEFLRRAVAAFIAANVPDGETL